MFIDTGKPACGENCNPSCGCGKYLEIWNDVFMEYNKTAEGKYEALEQKNVDTGMGLDRTIVILQGKESVYDTDVFQPLIEEIEKLSAKSYTGADGGVKKAFRIVADHIRCATFMIGDEKGITPSNVDQGYVLRRLLRRAIRFAGNLGVEENRLSELACVVIKKYGDAYPELVRNSKRITGEIMKEEERFQKHKTGPQRFEKARKAAGDTMDGKTR
jgi:alanyl-tRNA synthetase